MRRGKRGLRFWLCRCDCTKMHLTQERYLVSGYTKSCGCLKREASTKHGLSKHPSYQVHRGMMHRCYNPKCKAYPDYGGRGIAVCDRWHDVKAFIDDVGEPTTPKHQIDRVDNNGNYSPDNYRWATSQEQNSNTRANHFVTIGDTIRTVSAWARLNRIPLGTVFTRLSRGWDDVEAVTCPSLRQPMTG